ncbi:hypothetical protein HMPREF3036_00095 [Sutterella sp. KLE1602]|nr:hypothetical protein HMPREF3036_00095 [Sutterella sp. KLE1602]
MKCNVHSLTPQRETVDTPRPDGEEAPPVLRSAQTFFACACVSGRPHLC